MIKSLILLIITSTSVLLSSCNDEKRNYRFSRFFTNQERDTLLVDMVTLIGKKPKTADYNSRLELGFRGYYRDLASHFSMEYFYMADDTCYFYMIRPARSARGNIRGVGGKLTLDRDRRIDYFEESFNTPINDREELQRIGWRLFRELTEKKSIEGLLWNVDYIEWPDDRLKYDKEKREWRYDVQDGSNQIPVENQ